MKHVPFRLRERRLYCVHGVEAVHVGLGLIQFVCTKFMALQLASTENQRVGEGVLDLGVFGTILTIKRFICGVSVSYTR